MPIFHFVLLGIVLTVLVLSVINLVSAGVTLLSIMFVLMAIGSVIAFFKIRRFPLAVQDRAIRAEALKENLSNLAIKQEIKNWRSDHHRA